MQVLERMSLLVFRVNRKVTSTTLFLSLNKCLYPICMCLHSPKGRELQLQVVAVDPYAEKSSRIDSVLNGK